MRFGNKDRIERHEDEHGHNARGARKNAVVHQDVVPGGPGSPNRFCHDKRVYELPGKAHEQGKKHQNGKGHQNGNGGPPGVGKIHEVENGGNIVFHSTSIARFTLRLPHVSGIIVHRLNMISVSPVSVFRPRHPDGMVTSHRMKKSRLPARLAEPCPQGPPVAETANWRYHYGQEALLWLICSCMKR